MNLRRSRTSRMTCALRRFLLAVSAAGLWAHAPITPVLSGPLRVDGQRIVDITGAVATLRGAVLPDLDSATTATLGVLRVRWNFNAVRIPLRISDWQQQGQPYFDRAGAAVARARAADLIAILTVDGSPTRAFWTECATVFRDTPNIVFSLSRRPPPETDWQDLFDAVRSTGARQIVAAPAGPPLRGENVIYEGALSPGGPDPFSGLGRVPFYAGELALTNCAGVPTDPRAASDLVFSTLAALEDRAVSWTAAEFRPGSLLIDTNDYDPTAFNPAWRCGDPGMGQAILTWMTGDPTGFGYLRRDAIANAAGGPATPPSPGQLLSLYIEQMGPSPDQPARLDSTGRLPLELGGTVVYFDGQPAPILFAGQYQLNVQVPPTLTPGRQTAVEVVYRGVPSNRLLLDVAPAAPELFHDSFSRTAIALNENGAPNSEATPAAAGSIVVLFATGTGATTPQGIAGRPAAAPHPVLTQTAVVRAAGQTAETLFAGEVPGFVGLSQINVRLPSQLPAGPTRISLQVGENVSQAPVFLHIRN